MKNSPHISFEFFAAKTDEGIAKLKTTATELNKFNPEFYSVTYGAGGSTRDTTKNIVLSLQTDGYSAAPHLSFGGDTEQDVIELVQSYKDAGINKLVALRGDLPSGIGGTKQLVHANELVSLIRKHSWRPLSRYMWRPTRRFIPEAESYSKDIYWLGEKV